MRAGRKVALVLIPIAGAAASASCSLDKRGLFNTAVGDDAALSEHRAAWRARGLSEHISRGQMQELIVEFGGRCITDVAAWKAVTMEQPLDALLAPDSPPIACTLVARAWPPLSLPRAYFWTVVLRPMSSEMLRVEDFRRQLDTL